MGFEEVVRDVAFSKSQSEPLSIQSVKSIKEVYGAIVSKVFGGKINENGGGSTIFEKRTVTI